MKTYDDSLCPPTSPGRPDPVFWPKSGFSKNVFLKSIYYGKFFGTNFFPEKTCPGSGFAMLCPVSYIFYKPLFKLNQSHHLSWSHISVMFPDVRIRFSKIPYFDFFSIIWSAFPLFGLILTKLCLKNDWNSDFKSTPSFSICSLLMLLCEIIVLKRIFRLVIK